MSATNRGAQRHPDDFYATPAWAVDLAIKLIPEGTSILEPAAGEGAIVEGLLRSGVPSERIRAFELDWERARSCASRTGVATACVDFLANDWSGVDVIVMNPPYALAMDFILHSMKCVGGRGHVIALLRLNFLGAQKRAGFHRQHGSDVSVLPRRPSFTGSGTDATEYAWFVWGPGERNRWSLLGDAGSGELRVPQSVARRGDTEH
jgi:hypothetical protein